MIFLGKKWEKWGFISINFRYSLINKLTNYLISRFVSANLFARRRTRDFFDIVAHRTKPAVAAAARYGNPENFRHRPRRVLRMSLINPRCLFFSFTLRHSINKRRRRTLGGGARTRGCALLYAVLHFYPRPAFPRTFAEKALRQWESNDRG